MSCYADLDERLVDCLMSLNRRGGAIEQGNPCGLRRIPKLWSGGRRRQVVEWQRLLGRSRRVLGCR